MEHFPLYLKLTGKRIALIGNSADIVPKARLVAKTSAQIDIFADAPCEALASYLASHLGSCFDGVLLTAQQATRMPECHWLEQVPRISQSYQDRIFCKNNGKIRVTGRPSALAD